MRIVFPDSLRQCSAGEVGEIWISGPSVAQGYWRKAKETEETFNARIPEVDEGPFLRTGDLGFLKDGHLFITGRLKDLLIIRGQNYYPQDIELTVEQSHPILQPGSGAAFSVEIEGEERLVVVQEVAVRKDPESIVQSDLDELDALIKLISRNIVAGHELQAFAIVLIRKGTIPKTSSGKIQRHACRDAFLNRELYVLREWHERKQLEPVLPKPSNPESDGHVPYGLASWVAQEIARIQGIDQERVDLNQPFAAYGLDSLAAIEFAHKLQTEFEVEVEVSEFFGDSTITEVIRRATDTIGKRVSKRETEQPARYPLSYGQRALWFVHQTAPESAAYNIARVIRIATNLDVDALRLAFQALVDRHPCLRTIVVETAGEPVQQVAEKAEVSFEYFDARDWSQVELEKALVQQSQRPFSLTLGPLFRTVLYAQSEKECLLHVAVHHMVADYWSLTLLLDEIGKLYQAYESKVETHLVPLEYSYADFVEWQREKLSGPAGERLRDYWKNELAGELPPLSLPADHIRPPVQTFRGASFPFSLDARLTEALKRLGEEQQATLFTTLLAAFQVLLYRLTSQKQVIVGCPIAGRSRAEFANIAGYFVNAVPLRADFQQRQTFTEFLSQVRNRVSKAFAHELYPFSLMVEQLGIARDPAVPPIFQSAFAFQQTYGSRSEDFVRFALGQPQAQVTLGGLQLEHVAVEQQTAQFDLTLTVGEGPDGIVGAWEYSSDLFEHSTIVRWSENFKVLLQAIVKDTDCQVSRFAMLSAEQRRQIVEEFNHTQLNYDCQQCVHDEISRQAMCTPDRTAVAFGATELSYQQLERRSNQVAHYLRKLGVGPDVRVGVCLDRSVELVVFLLGVLKTGGVYVPLDPGYPAERLQYMAQDAQAPVVIVQKRQVELFANLGVQLICGEDQQAEIERESVADVGVRLEDDNLAYVIYTSGSTGKPKGAMNTHRGLQNRLQWMQEKYQLTSDDRVLQKTPFSFDVSVWEFFWPLMVGARLVMAEPGMHQDPEYLGQTIEQQKVTTIHFVPSMLQAFLESGEAKKCEKLRRIICSGEALSAELAGKCLKRIPAELHNLYGPTEAAIDVTYWPCRREDLAGGVAIGKPIANTQMYVLDAEYEPVPVGVEGEIYIAGVGLARGYWNRPDLTAERFIANPLSTEGGARMYRTGDRGRWRRDGNLEYLGRFDHQVKLRGFRIELGEIEACLAKFEGVKETVVEVRGATAGDKRLVAYIVPDEVQARPLRKMARLKKAGDLTESKLYELPNGMLVKFQNKSETDFLYREIFEGEGYLRHGITLEANACVFDIGANIGMFSLFVAQLAPAATVYAFEPIPAVFDDLRINMELYVGNPRAFNCGLAGESGTVTFTWYRHDSVLSGRYADLKEESSTVKSFLKSQSESKDLSDEDLDRLLAERLSGERVECQLRTLSSVIAEEKIERIDLLKIDVEKSELDVLEGIEDHDWEKIRQIVLEVHDSDGRLAIVKRMLEAHGYELHIEQDELLQTTNLYNIYARQTKNVPRAEGAGISPHPVRVPTYFSPAQFITSLKNHLKTLLPEYMVPAAYVCLDRLPRTPNGKLDRKALPAPEADGYAAHAYEAPQGEVETKLVGIWAEVLKIERIGRNNNFFDLGGHSLLATQVTSRIRQAFEVDLPLRNFLETPTVAGLARSIESSTRIEAPPLRRRSRQERIRLSFGQERLWFLSRYEAEASLYNVPIAVRLRGALNIEAAQASLQEMVNRHEVLRTSFPEVGDSTIQDIAAEMEMPFAVAEIREDELDQVLREQARRSFDLSHGPLIRASLFHISSQDHVLLVVMHHIVSDGWSLGVMLREFNVLYDSFSRGAASPLPPLPIQYADYSEWQREWLQGEVLEQQLDYWRKQLAGHETLNLPTDRPHSAKPTLAGAMERSRLPEPLVSKLKLLSDQQGVTLFMTLLAGFEILLYRYTGQTDISVGSGIANRNRQELEPLIGFFVNTLVLRTQFTEDSSVAELLQRVRDVSLQAYAHQDIPFERLVEALDPVRELSRTPFFQALFVLQNAPLPTVSWDGLEATASILETGTAKFDLTLSAREEDGELELSLEYRTELFNAERMKRLLQHYRTLLEGIVVSVDARISELEILSEPERQQLLVEWNRTEASYSTNKCVHELFEERVAKTPQAVAVMDEDRQISYGELNRHANQLAHYLTKLGIGPEVRVGICMERGLEMMVDVLGVLKAGGAYVPLDPADPSARRSYMVKDAGAKFVLTNERFIHQMAGCAEHVVDLKEAREEIEKQSSDNLNVHVDPENLAWVIYTSSSTGLPKGTAIPHRSAVSMLQRTLIDAMDQNPSVERWLNLYGSTEDTTYATYAEVKHDEQGAVTTGRSQSNTQAYVLDRHMKLVPVGIKGELYISGSGQARGYLSRPELTAEKFVPNPFSQASGERLYRTGDLVRYQENGNLEFLGRLDDQVKIQGYRIEPGEIEAAVLEYPGIAQAAVVAREDKLGEMRLIGYVVGGEKLDVDRLRGHLQQRVPEYMVPVALLQLDTLPLTANGKVDRKALIELESKKAMETGSLTLTPTEELIAGVWSGLLGKSDIRRDDNFFDLGGHSLTSIQMLARLEQVFNREIELRAVFEFPVLKDFSAYIDQLTGPAQLATLRPIVPTSRSGDLPLSFAQQRLWFLAQMEGASAAYHIPFGLHLKGDLNRTALRRALDRIVVRHEVLRTSFALHDGEPVQEIGAVEASSFRLIEHDLCGHNDVEAELAALSELEAGASFDLEAGPLIRGQLIRLAEDEHVLLVTMHHIVSDGWSMGVLVSELNALYGAFLGGEADPLPELEIQYADYAVWQRQWIEGEILQQQAAYWKITLAGAPALLALPMDRVRPVQQSYAGAALPVVLEEKLTSGLKGLSRRNGTTLYMTLLAGWAILLARLSGQQDVVIGSPAANRGRAEIENLIGFFVNTLALRLDLSGSPSVSELLQQSKAQSLAAQRHQDISFEQVVELAQPVRSLAHSPLFQVMFAWQNATEARLELPGLEVQLLPSASHRVAKFDLTLSLQEVGERIVGELEYATALYERSTLERYREYFLRLVEAMVADDTQVVDHLRLLTETERHQVLYEWNATEREYPRDKCVHELFEEQVRRSPEATAVVFEEEELSYGELNARANRLAHYLRELGVKPDERVAICVERGFEMIVGLLAILKAGGGYVPLDPAYPEERLRYMLEDSDPVVLLTQKHLQGLFSGIRDRVRVLDLSDAVPAWSSQPESNPDGNSVGLTSKHLAYVIYTSGSTGQPKGVTIEHRNTINFTRWAQLSFAKDALERTLFSTSLNFDLAIYECFVPITVGATIRIVPNALDLLRTPVDVTLINTVPSAINALIEGNGVPKTVQVVNLAGEPLKHTLVERIFAATEVGTVCNLYGPTETTTYSTWTTLKRGEAIASHIGRPIANTRIYLLDRYGEPVPVGVVGEMYIGGAGVARGYLKRPELTAERFVQDPFVEEAGARMYRTGDLGRWRADGNIEFVGRNDNQVKIRGFRIELGEIEARLAEHPEVREAVVLAREDTAGEKRLVAYYTWRESSGGVSESSVESVGAERLRAHLSAVVPDYMVPAAYVRMERLPLTPNGKLDRKALPAPEQNAYAVRGYEAPVGEMETKLAEVWAEVLKLEKVGRHDNFFDLGGHSLLAVRVVSRLQQVWSVEVAIRDLFAHADLADLARHLQGAAHAELSRILPAKRSGDLPLSFAQQRLWFLAQMEGASAAYHIPFGLHLKGDLNRTALRRALDRIVVRHEVLRTSFALHDGEPVQEIGAVEASSFRLIEHDLCGHNDVEAELAALSELEAGASFDLEAGPLIRGQLIRLAEDEHVLLVTMHHIVSDGWSMGVLVSELNALYGAFLGGEADPLPELEIQYADYAVWQRQWIEGEILQQQAAYWKITLAGAPALLALPMDRVRPVQQSYAGAALPVVLEEKLTSGLKGLSRRNGTTLYMTLLAGWAILLARLSGQQDVVIGSPAANRGRAEIENLIGFFVNTLALRLDLSGSPSVSELLQQSKAQSLAAQRHQDISFEQVVELAQPVRSLAHSPLFQVMFAWQNATESSLELPGLALLPLQSPPHKVAQFDLTLFLREEEETIVGGIEYATSLFEPATIERYLGYFRTLLEAMVADDTQAVHRLSMLPESERHQLLYEWNDTKTEFPADKCVHQLFEEQAAQRPEAVAVVHEDRELSYGELNRRANQLAHYLRELDIRPDIRVAICLERSFEMIVALLAVLKAGGAYVPMDPAYPAERLGYLLEDSAPAALLTQGHLQGLFTAASATLPVIDLAAVTPRWKDQPETNPDHASIGLTSGHLAYVIYTSGSTGMPKGVMLEHRGLTNQIKAMQGELRLSSGDRMLQFASVAFDVSAEEIFCTLLAGAVLVLRSENWLTDASEFWLLCARQNLSVIDLPTRFWQQISNGGTEEDIPRCIRLATTGGELVSQDSLRSWFERRGHRPKLLIAYGPTEATINTTIHEPTSNPSTWESIGRPIANTRIYILDGNRQPVPVGVTGELYIGGAGVARGYLNQEELTAERFVADGFSGTAGARLYRTGDLGRWLADGNIEFLGRNDFQVKVRGFRIELGEIEARLQEYDGVGESVVVVREDTAGDKRLVAYVVPDKILARALAEPKELVAALRVHLSGKLPEYMVPNAFVFLPSMPLTSSGKIDRKALPTVKSTPKSSGQANLPLRHTERILTDIWTRILKIDEVGVEEKFFDVGGHSLLIPEVRLAVQKAFGTDLPIVDFFQYPTIRSLAERLDATRSVPEVKPLSWDKTVKAEQPRSGTKGFAIVGMACRFQDAANVEEFWQNLQGGVESITDFTEEELRAAGVSEELIASSDYVKRGSVVANTDLFDARFFDISAREAEVINPQQRIFLECAWEALENAGYAVKNYPGKIGLYAGSGLNTYFLNLLAEDGSLYSKDAAGLLFANADDFLTTRVSYKLDLTGPSVTVQTACSTSLVAVHMACRALLNHECDMAMAGGITIHTPQNIGDIFQEGGIISRDGHCRTFDERAQGTVKGAGGGIVVIKRLEDALRDGDHIRAVIKGSAINNDGGNKVGYTAPSITGQCNVIQEALLESGVRPETITYLEAHGTATALGDPIEVSALTQAYRGAGTEKIGFCAIGSVKSNIGHADAAAGIAGLIKTVLALEHKLIPPTLHFERPNPKIDFDHSPFYVNTKLNEWNTGNVPRRAGVSSFGIGGTNAHVIVEEAPSNDSISACRPWQLVLLSAKTATALETAADNLGRYLQKHDSVSLADVAHTLQVGRAPFAHRCFVVAESVADTIEALQCRHTRAIASSVVPREACRVAFLFPGQGSQYVSMGKHLYSHEPLFRELVDQCSELLQPSLQLDLRSVLYPSAEKHQWAETELRETRTTQPALFVIEYALARVWMSWGLQPESMVGHSIGEYVAACLAGVFSLEDALNLVALRGRLMHSCERGGMLAVAASEEEVQPYLKMGLELAAINGSRSCVLTGPIDSLELAEKELLQQQVIHRRLQSSHAFHSSMMEPIVGQFAAEVQRVRLNAPRMRYLSNLTGDWITVEQATDPVYWSKQLRSTVQFAQALRNLFSGADRLALEVGPGHSNSTAIRQTIAKPSLPVMLSSLPDANTEESDVKQMLTALGQLWLHGADADWNAFESGEKRRRIPLPTYPFERQRYWVESPASRQSRPDTSRRKLTDWLYLPSWKEARRVALSAESEVEENSTVLVFGGNSAMAEKLALRLEQKRYSIVTVVAGREFARIDHRTYAINPAARSDYEALFSALREQGQLPKKILHLWNVGHNTSLEQDLDLALYSPLHLIQAATAEPGIGPIQCMIVSSGLHEITGNESLSPAKATLLGLCKTVLWELPDFACKSVDIEAPAEGSWTEHSLLDQLVAESESKEQQPVVSYRGARRWIQTFEQSPLEAAGGPELVRERGVYLITGGLNKVGFEFAEWLASDAHAAVVLVDSLPFPPREQWNAWPETHVDNPVIKQIDRIRRWEQSGAKVLISNVNVADQNQMRELRDQVREVWGKIDGVIHAAGFSEKEPIASKTRTNIAAVLAPKVQGASVLDEVFAGEDLDFMVFCSSLISVVGEAEQADYAAANAFLDSLARCNFFRSRCFTMSINWDVWAVSDSAVSGAANDASTGGIRSDEAVEVLRRLLRAKPGPQAIISTRDLALVARRKKVGTTEEAASATGRVYARINLDRPIDLPTNATEALLVPIWTEVLGVSPIGIRDDFFDLGGDSLIGLRLTSRLQDLGIHVSIEQLFRHRTIQELAADIEEGKLSPAGHERPQSSSVLVSIQPQGSRAPLFFVHPVGGHVICYAELSQEMGLEQPFYGLQSPPANLFPESSISIEQMATLYNREIRSVQPVGPYLLSGWSMGGLVAWEMAQQLVREGETIGLLALMDTTPPSGYLEADDRDDEISMLARFALDMSRLVGKDPRPLVEQFFQADAQDQWKMVQETLTSSGVLAPKTAHAEMTALLDVYTRNALAMNNYSIQTSKQSVVYFRASETPERFSKLWTKWAGGGIQFHSVPGDHFTILRRPNVRIIAEALERHISANGSKESQAVSPEMSPRELIDIESQHTP